MPNMAGNTREMAGEEKVRPETTHPRHEDDDLESQHSSVEESPPPLPQGGADLEKRTAAPNTTAAAAAAQSAARKPTTTSRMSTELHSTASNILTQITSRITTRNLPEPAPPPDGGLKAWTQVAMGWLVVFTTWGYVNSFGAFQTYYTTQQSPPLAPPSTVSWIGSVQVFLTLTIGAFSGRLLDAGLFVPTFLVGAVLQVAGMFLMSASTQYWQLMLTQGVLTGIGGGIFFTPSLALVATYFSKRRGLAIGLLTTSNSTGGMVYPLVVRQLMPLLGFAWTCRVLAFINLGCLSVVFALMRPRLPPRKSGPVIDLSAFREGVYVAFVVGLFLCMWGNYYTFYYIASFGTQTLGLSYADASILIIILNGAGLLFRVIFPMIADRIGMLNVITPITFTWFIVSFSWLAVSNVPGYYAFTVFYGILSGGMQSLIPTTVASITKRLDMVGTRLGMVFTIVSFASLTGPPLGGALQGAQGGSYVGAQAWAAAVTMLGFLFFLAARIFRGGWQLRARC